MKKVNKPDIIKVAEQKRHLHLLSKIQEGKTLTNNELKELKQLESKNDIQEGYVDSRDKLAKVFNVSKMTISRWTQEGMPVTDDGFFNILEIQNWRIAKDKKSNDGPEDFDAKYREIKYRLADLQLKEKTGDLISKDKVKQDLGNEILIIKQQFLSLPKQVAPQLVGLEIVEIEDLLERRLKEIIHGFAKGQYR